MRLIFPAHITMTGMNVDSIPTDKPVIMFTAAPDCEEFAMLLTGLCGFAV